MTIKIPKAYAQDLTSIASILGEVEKTHPHLGDLTVFSVLCDSGNRTLIAIAISGTGKSTVCNWIAGNEKRHKIAAHGISTNGLKHFQDELSSNSVSVCVEDLSRSGSVYMQIQTTAVLAGLVYTGFIQKQSATLDLEIYGFKGSALIYAQPLIMAEMVKIAEFESDIRDKTIRYYHLFRPLTPDPLPFSFKHAYDSIDRIDITINMHPNIKRFYEIALANMEYEVSKARAMEHTQALMKASACVNQRVEVKEADAWLIAELTKNMRLEQYLYTKHDLEGARYLDNNLLPLLTDVASTREIALKEVARKAGITEKRAYAIVKTLSTWVLLNSRHLHPTKECKAILQECGIWQN